MFVIHDHHNGRYEQRATHLNIMQCVTGRLPSQTVNLDGYIQLTNMWGKHVSAGQLNEVNTASLAKKYIKNRRKCHKLITLHNRK